MKHIKSINEIFGVKKLWNKDEKIVYGIIDSVTTETSQNEYEVDGDPFIMIDVDGYEVKVGILYQRNPQGVHYSNKEEAFKKYKVWVDGVEMKCSYYVAKKLWDKCKNIKEEDNKNYVRKDAKIHFTKNR